MSATTFTLLDEWEDEDENDGEWPYPTQYKKSRVEGELAEQVRAKLGVADDAEVIITEEIISGGWSEYTQENEYNLEVEAGGASRYLDSGFRWNCLDQLLKWVEG